MGAEGGGHFRRRRSRTFPGKTSFLNVEIQKGALKNLARINNLLNVKKDFAK